MDTTSHPTIQQAVNDDLAACAELSYVFEVNDPQLPIECGEAVWRIQDLLYPECTPASREDGQHHPA